MRYGERWSRALGVVLAAALSAPVHARAASEPPSELKSADAAQPATSTSRTGTCPPQVLERRTVPVRRLSDALCRPLAEPDRARGPTAVRGAPPIEPESERPLPDYGQGRQREPDRPWLWIPRVALFPLYLVSEYVVRRPLALAVTNAERAQVGRLLLDFFTFGRDRQAGVFPTAFLDFGFRPSVGLFAYVNELGDDDTQLRAQVSWGGRRWLSMRGLARYFIASNQQVSLRGSYWRRPDWVFYGLGGSAPEQAEGRFLQREVLGELGYEIEGWRSSSFESYLTLREVNFDAAIGCCDDPSVAQRIAEGAYAMPPGMTEGFFILQQQLSFALDSRPVRQPEDLQRNSDFTALPGSGVRWVIHGEHAAMVKAARPLPDQARERSSWVRLGSQLAGFVDLTGQQRVLGAGLWAEVVEPLRGGVIPFTQLVALGGERPLHGFLERRLLDRSAVVARVFYTWPVWVFLDGSLVYEVGNVFEERWSNFSFGQLRNSIALGLRSSIPRDNAFQFLVALGTTTFEEGSRISNVRLVVGTSSDF